MASIFLRPILRPQVLGLGLGLSIATVQMVQQRPMLLDTKPMLSGDSYATQAQTPVVRDGQLNPKAVRQISSGSVVGKSSISAEGM